MIDDDDEYTNSAVVVRKNNVDCPNFQRETVFRIH